MIMDKFYAQFGISKAENPNNIKALDGLRGVAVLFVLFSHSSNMGMHLAPFIRFEHIGKSGVYLFFILSAFLLDRQIFLKLNSGKANGKYWYNYIMKRLVRIYPAYLIALILYTIKDHILYYFNIKGSFIGLQPFVDHLLLIKGQGHFWSIPTEIKYYLFSPILMVLLFKLFKFRRIYVNFSMVLIISLSVFWEYKYGLAYMSVFRYLPIFLVGMWISIFGVELADKISHSKLNILALVALFIVFISMPFYFQYFFGLEFDYRASYLFLPYALLWGVVLLALIKQSLISSFFEMKFLRFIGVISFSVYLYHQPLLILVDQLPFIPGSIKGIIAILLSLFVGAVAYLLVDKNLVKYRYLLLKK
jgi:peptidoglycan/LPS O-acetylase OafA/YrhL